MATQDLFEVSRPDFHLLNLVVLGSITGFLVHNILFIRGEWHVKAPNILIGHFLVFVIPVLGNIYLYQNNIDTAFLQAVSFIGASYLSSLYGSIIIYRLVFHRLSRAGFPGPVAARITKLWHAWACRNSQNHLLLEKLRQEYGDFVRTGPSEVTVFHPEVFHAIDGLKSECIKSDWYDLILPSLALVTSRDKRRHQERRRLWKRGFTAQALAQYETRLLKYVNQLDTSIHADATNGTVSNVTDLFNWFAFDAMGDIAFNKSFNMLQKQETHSIITMIQSALSLLGPWGPVPWAVQIGLRLMPRIGVFKDWHVATSWCEVQMRAQIQGPENEKQDPCLARLLRSEDCKDESTWLKGDSLLTIVAGSQPVTSSLIAIFYELAKHPYDAERIYAEIRDIDTDRATQLASLPHLNGVINESLRLHPALPSGGNRVTTERGVTVAGRYIPPHTTIAAPQYSIARRESCFVDANEFVPERWYERPEMILDKAAYAPFGTGNHSCIGKFLALDEMRLLVARLIKKYRVRFAPHEDSERVIRDWKDQFSSRPGILRLEFTLRTDRDGSDDCKVVHEA